MKGKLLFKEDQSFVGTWMWYLVIGIAVISFVGTAVGLIFKDATAGIIGLIIVGLVTSSIVGLFYKSKLQVSIDQEQIYYRFPPFVNNEKKIGRGDIKEINIRRYRAIREYGGWGYRYRFRSGRAISVAGNTGLQLVLKNDKRLLIGTQKPELMKQAVRRLKENWGLDG